MALHGIRAQLLGLVVAATAPFVILIGAGIWHQWQSEHQTVTERALQEARLVAAQVDDQLGNFDNLITGLSRAVSVDPSDSKANEALLVEVKSELPDFVAHLVLFSPDGYSTATSLGNNENDPFYAGDRLYFRRLVGGSRISVGEPIQGRVTGNWLINVGRALNDSQGRLRGVLTVGIWLERFQDALRLNHLPPGTVVRIVAENGIVIAQSANGPNRIGHDISEFDNFVRHMSAGESSELVTWSDGVSRMTGSSTAHRAPWVVSVGFPTNIALAAVASRLRWSAAASAIVLIAAFAVAWTLSGKIVRPIQQLGRDAAMLAAGDLAHRSPIRARGELGDLAGSFNQMAQSFEQRQREAKQSSDEVRQTKDTLAALIENVPVPIVLKETKSLRITLVNRAYEKFLGISRTAMIGRTVQEFFPASEAQTISEFDERAIRHDEPVISGEFSVHTPDNDPHLISTIRLLVRDGNGAAEHLMVVIDDVTERKKAEEKIWHMAHHDALTGLSNRTQYYERLDQELNRLGRGENLAVLYLDLDNFKNVNDTLGHLVGDEMLKIVTERLRSCVRETDIIARLSGDEFAIIQTPLEQPIDASMLASRIQERLREPLDLGSLNPAPTASIGISLAPANATTADELMKQADMALYEAKAAGRKTYRFFEPEMDVRMKARQRLECELRKAIVHGELELHYQPVIDLGSNAVVGVEGLVRWRHPLRGMLHPGEFIPLAEETGLIVPLGEWVLRRACEEAAQWPAHIKVAVNLSPAQIKSHRLMPVVISALAASRLAPHRLELEITEQVLLEDDDETLTVLQQLHALGVQIVMDDFGTKYSSLNYVRRFPLNKIKIDRSFVNDLSNGNQASIAIVEAVVRLANALKLPTTAEGVETPEQLELVRAAGCTEMQGYLFSPPKPMAEILKLLQPAACKAANAA